MSNFKVTAGLGVTGDTKLKKQFKGVSLAADKLSEKLESAVDGAKIAKNTQKSVKALRALESKVGKTANEMALAKKATSKLARELARTKNPAAKLKREFAQTQAKAKKLSDTHRKLKQETASMRQELRKAGNDTRDLGALQAKVDKKARQRANNAERVGLHHKRADEIRKIRDRRMSKGANMTFAGGAMAATGYGMMRAFNAPVEKMRSVQRSRGELQSLGMSAKGVAAVENKGVEMAGKLAGITTDGFISASYDIKSGISTLTDEGVASMTASAALVAKATKGGLAETTKLFALGHGIFKKQMGDLSDAQFGEQFGAAIATSVQKFRTDGSDLVMGLSTLSASATGFGVSLEEQLSVIGVGKGSFDSASNAATGYEAFLSGAVKAQKELNLDFTNKVTGELLSTADILDKISGSLKKNGLTIKDAEVQNLLKKAFGRKEAVKTINALLSKTEELRKSEVEIRKNMNTGSAFTGKMASDMDGNMDARMQIMSQKMDLVKLKIGQALIPALEKMIPWVDKITTAITSLIDSDDNGITQWLVGIGAAIAGIMVTGGPLIMAAGSLMVASAHLRASAQLVSNSRGAGAVGAPVGFKGKLGNAKNVLAKGSKVAGKAAVVGTIISVGMDVFDDEKTRTEVLKNGIETAGGLAGAAAGAAVGAAVGSFIPIIGTALGGLIGGSYGYMGGDFLGSSASGLIDDDSEKEKKSETIFNQMVSEGAVDHDWIGNSEIEDWKAIAKLSSDKLKALIAYGDFAKSDIFKIKGIIQNNKNSKIVKGGPMAAAVIAGTVVSGAMATTSPAVVEQLKQSQVVMQTIKNEVKKPAIINQNNSAVYNLKIDAAGLSPEEAGQLFKQKLLEAQRIDAARNRAALYDGSEAS